ncbi:hypothetical protein BKK56_09350 [Rodentibacter genomosp. 2]|uniref:toxin VasX n=1 Tax=Rodentibacter genomosp. 2 TaxID=1908266 RepID=UPI0009849CF1|nr:hypothetical protein BKK56_09350 [Rodentibacter genomosp. 2]
MVHNSNNQHEQNNHIDTIADEFSAINNPTESSKKSGCGNLPLIPILPVRYGLTLDYTSSAINGKVSDIPKPAGLNETNIHWIQTLRQGFVYIYAPSGHHDISTDMKNGKNSGGNWLVFRYSTHSNDANSSYKFEDVETDAVQQTPHFFLYSWGEKGAAGDWKKHSDKICKTLNKTTAFIHKDTSQAYIAYSEYPWPAELFTEVAKKDDLRTKLMVELNTTPGKETTPHTCPIDLAVNKVKEFLPIRIAKLITDTVYRHTRMKNEEWKGSDVNLNEKGLMVVLQDSLGEIKELQACHANILDRITKCDLEYQYPLTIGTLIDPTTIYEASGKPIPKEFTQESIKKKLTNQYQYLVPNFRKRLIQLIKEKSQQVEKYEKDLEKIVQQIIELHKRDDIFVLLQNVRGIAEQIQGEPLACLKAHQFSCYVISDALAEIPTSTAGSQYLLQRFSEQKSDMEKAKETKDTIDEFAGTLSNIIEKAEHFSLLAPSKRQQIERLIYQSISILMTQVGTVFMFAAANAPVNNFIINRAYYFRLFGLDYIELRTRSYAYLYEYTRQFRRRVAEMKLQLTAQPSESLGAQAQQKVAKILERDISKNTNATFASLGLFLSFAAFADINDKIRSAQMLAKSTIGKIAHAKWIELPTAAIQFTIETIGVGKTVFNAPIVANIVGSKLQFIPPLLRQLSTRINRVIPIREFKYTNNVLMLMGGLTFSADAWEDYLDQDYISMAGNVVSGIGALLAAFNVVTLGWGTLIIFIGQYIGSFGYEDFEDWLRTCIWGNSRLYLNENRADMGLENILIKSKVLATPDNDSFKLIKETFNKELSDFNILTSSLSISEQELGVFIISCNDFSNNIGGLLDLTITYDYVETFEYARGTRMPNKGNNASYEPIGETSVQVDLKDEINRLKAPIKLNVRYITSFGTTLTQNYRQTGYTEESIYKPAPF